jgi:hypothetical protein
MRTFVEITGGKLKRVSNRRDGCYYSRNEEDEQSTTRADHRRDRRVSRQQLRLKAGQLNGDSDVELDDFPRDGTTIINAGSGMRQRSYA